MSSIGANLSVRRSYEHYPRHTRSKHLASGGQDELIFAPACDQILYTHCTYATAALVRGASDSPYGYSARASNLTNEALQQVCRRSIEPLLGRTYDLPPDTPADSRSKQSAQTAPVRLCYEPTDGEACLLGRVVYRPFDVTDERVGSYFAHFITLADSDISRRTQALDCLRLWAAPGWQSEDSPQIKWDLPALPSPSALLGGRRAAISESVVRSFLTSDDGRFDDPQRVIPAACRAMPSAERRQIVETLLGGVIEIENTGQPRRILLVAEPGFAALLFFAVLRLLPQQIAEQYASFSTYETDLQTLPAALVATSFFDTQRGEVLPERRAAAAFFYDVRRQAHSTLSPESITYPARILKLLCEQGWDAVDRWLARLESAPAAELVERTLFEEIAERWAAQGGVLRSQQVASLTDFDSRQRSWLAAALVDHLRHSMPAEDLSTSALEQRIATLPASLERDLLETALDLGQRNPAVRPWASKLAQVWPLEWIRQTLLAGHVGLLGAISAPCWAARFQGELPLLADPVQADDFSDRLRILELLSAWLDESQRASVARWSQLCKSLAALRTRAARPLSDWFFLSWWRQPCSELLNALATVLPDQVPSRRMNLLAALLESNCPSGPNLPEGVRLALEQLLIWPTAAARLSQLGYRLKEQRRDSLPYYAHQPPQLILSFPKNLPSFISMQVELRMNCWRGRWKVPRFRIPTESGKKQTIKCEPWPSDRRTAIDVWLRMTFTAPAWPKAIVSNWLPLNENTLQENCRYFVTLEAEGIGQDDPRFLDCEAGARHDVSIGSHSP